MEFPERGLGKAVGGKKGIGAQAALQISSQVAVEKNLGQDSRGAQAPIPEVHLGRPAGKFQPLRLLEGGEDLPPQSFGGRFLLRGSLRKERRKSGKEETHGSDYAFLRRSCPRHSRRLARRLVNPS